DKLCIESSNIWAIASDNHYETAFKPKFLKEHHHRSNRWQGQGRHKRLNSNLNVLVRDVEEVADGAIARREKELSINIASALRVSVRRNLTNRPGIVPFLHFKLDSISLGNASKCRGNSVGICRLVNRGNKGRRSRQRVS